MIKHLPFTDTVIKSLSALVPELQIEIANSKLIRGQTAKGRYDIRVWGEGAELRTSFLGRGRNPLKQAGFCFAHRSPMKISSSTPSSCERMNGVSPGFSAAA